MQEFAQEHTERWWSHELRDVIEKKQVHMLNICNKIKRHVTAYMDIKEVKRMISRSKREANEPFSKCDKNER